MPKILEKGPSHINNYDRVCDNITLQVNNGADMVAVPSYFDLYVEKLGVVIPIH